MKELHEQKISIIIPVFNCEPYLRRCLDSVVGQTYKNLEIILIDDGSTDGSGAVCDEYVAKDGRFKVIHSDHVGQSGVRNQALSAVTGDYIGYVDSDDFAEPKMYELMLEAMTAHKAQIAVCRHRALGFADASLAPESGGVYPYSREEALDSFISEARTHRIMPSIWSKLFAREVARGIEFDDTRYMSDFMYTTKAMCRADKIVYVDKCLYNYDDTRSDSLTNQKTAAERVDVSAPIYREQIAYLRARNLDELADKAAHFFYRRLLFFFVSARQDKDYELCGRIAAMLKDEKREIKTLGRNPWVKSGDRVRMNVFLFSPRLYYILDRAYERIIIPLRTRKA